MPGPERLNVSSSQLPLPFPFILLPLPKESILDHGILFSLQQAFLSCHDSNLMRRRRITADEEVSKQLPQAKKRSTGRYSLRSDRHVAPVQHGIESRSPAVRSQRRLLPECEGPKMHPYEDRNPKIEFESLLGDSNTASHSHVFKVLLNSRPFALKMRLIQAQFRFFDPLTARDDALWEEQSNMIPDDEFVNHVDPFYAECRAYGRIQEFYEKHPRREITTSLLFHVTAICTSLKYMKT
ncbi:hypothetical protein H2199_002690 [Coniosporium tulheliwenetii]|uniref:Uncharacterized protein n=1 Tax=Coniosporium tulheliwenetii TaxID=3383036 RepID=A0ACC2ZH50_9PEZI|nr:hypothetical protein H2199_002690 [Cladosporium sp. JES 115]